MKNDRIYCWLTSEYPQTEDALINQLRTILPAVMVPTRIIQLNAFPLNSNGKTNEKQLFSDLSEQSSFSDDRVLNEAQKVAEEYLKKIWSQILNIDSNVIKYNSDFRKLGASSLQFMELGVKILQDLNKKVNFVELYLNSKLNDMSQILIANNNFQPIYTFVKRTKEMGANPALFVIHSGNTGSDVYRPLFEEIAKPTFPIYVIEPHNLLTSGNRISGIENLASYYVDLIENFPPEKNYKIVNLAGWSYGGVVASEMCHQFLNEVSLKNVTKLVILDSPFYLDKNDIDLAIDREKNGYLKKYFEETHIFEGKAKKNITTEKLIDNNHLVFQDLINYQPKMMTIQTIFVRSVVEDNPIDVDKIKELFKNCDIIDVFTKHDYLFIEPETCNIIKRLLNLVPISVESR